MKKPVVYFVFISSILFFVNCSEDKIGIQEIGIVNGRVVTENTFLPIANVRVSSKPNTSIVFTDADGKFEFPSVPTGDYSFEARKEGYVAKFEAVTVSSTVASSLVYELKVSTSGNVAPAPAILTIPADNATNQNLSIDFTWTVADPEMDIITSKLILRNDTTDEVLTYNNILSKNIMISNLNFSTKYFWQVVVNDGINADIFSPLSSFRTKEFPNSRYLYSRKAGNSNNLIYTSDQDGNQLQLTSMDKNSFRPQKNMQSSKIAFIQSDGAQNHIFTMNLDGTNLFKVTNSIPIAGFNFDFVKFCWKNNGSQILYPNFNKLFSINTDGTGLAEIFQTPNGKFITEVDWSMDGSVIILKVNDSRGYNVEIYAINQNGVLLTSILSGANGAVNGIHLSANNQKLVFTRDVSEFQNDNYRQLDSRIYIYNFTTSLTYEVRVEKPAGFNDLDVKFSPNEAELIFVSTSNDGFSQKNIVKYTLGDITSRVTLFQNATMPDWK